MAPVVPHMSNFYIHNIMPTTSKQVQLKDKSGNLLYPSINGKSIPAKSVDESKLSEELQTKLSGVATDKDLTALKSTVNTLNGADTVEGSVKKQVKDAVSSKADSSTVTTLAGRVTALETSEITYEEVTETA